jgi:hypothetical protein
MDWGMLAGICLSNLFIAWQISKLETRIHTLERCFITMSFEMHPEWKAEFEAEHAAGARNA